MGTRTRAIRPTSGTRPSDGRYADGSPTPTDLVLAATVRVKWGWPEGGRQERSAELHENDRRLKAQLRAASGRTSKLLKDAGGIEAVVEVPGRGTLTLSVQKGGGYSLRAARPKKTDDARGQEGAERDLVAVGVLGGEEVVSVVPG